MIHLNGSFRAQKIHFSKISFRCPGQKFKVWNFLPVFKKAFLNLFRQFHQIGISVKIIAADGRMILKIEFTDLPHCRLKHFSAVADIRPAHGCGFLYQRLSERLQPISGFCTDCQALRLRIMTRQPFCQIVFSLGIYPVTFVKHNQIRFHQLCVIQVRQISARPVLELVQGLWFHQHGEWGKLKLTWEFLFQSVIDMFQRPDTEAWNIRNDNFDAIGIVSIQAVSQIFILITDTFICQFGCIASAELGITIICQVDPVSKIIGDHRCLYVVFGKVFCQRHHRCGFSCTEEPAEHCKLSHLFSSFSRFLFSDDLTDRIVRFP